MRVCSCLVALTALFSSGPAAHAQLLLPHSGGRMGEFGWRTTYLGWAPQTWVKGQAPLTAELAAQAADRPADSLALVVPADGRIRLPNGVQFLRLHLLNPTARPAAIERADATMMGVSLLLRVDGRWVQPVFPKQTYCGNSFWQDTLAPRSVLTLELDADNFYRGSVPVEAQARAQLGTTVVQSAVFTVQLTPLQLYYLRYPRVPVPDIPVAPRRP